MKRQVIFLLALIWLLSGCANNIKEALEPSSFPETGTAYLAGSFVNSYRESFARMALEIVEVDTNIAYLIELRQPSNHTGIEILPFESGRYQLVNLVELGGVGDVGRRMAIENQDLREVFELKSGKILYLGHFDGRSTNDILDLSFIGPYVGVTTDSGYGFIFKNHILGAVVDELTTSFPGFAQLEAVPAFTLKQAKQEGRR